VQRTSSDSGFELESKRGKEKREVSSGDEIYAVIARGSEHL
jgi:hypothetical protein